MGSSSSRLGSRPPRPPRAKRNSRRRQLLSLFVCGAASTSHPHLGMEDNPAELQVNSAEYRNPVIDKFQISKRRSGLAATTESRFCSRKVEHTVSSESDIEATEGSSFEESSGGVETSNNIKGLCRGKETRPPHRLSLGCRRRDIASTSREGQPSSEPVSANRRVNLDVASGIDNIMDKDVSQICPRVPQSCILSWHELGDSSLDGMSVVNHASEVTSVDDSDSATVSFDSPVNFDLQRNDNFPDSTPSGMGFTMSDREQGQRDESLLLLDITSTSSILSGVGSNSDTGNREARHNSRRLFWDSFSRRNSRRHSDSRTYVVGSDHIDDLGSHDRWLLDFNGDCFDDGIAGDAGLLGSSTRSINERHWHSRSEIWERLRTSRSVSDHRTNICPTGLHPNGECGCESILMTEESSARASISRIVMLAEALFEVLDEIHRQPVSFSLSMSSLPAPKSVVDSLPVKNHKMTPKTGDETEQCYICLAEYEEADKIRVLPCQHEYHMSCIDKWLKEIHGVCPLCRGDVRESLSEASVSNPGVPSL